MKKREATAIALLAVTAGLMYLNYREKDHYPPSVGEITDPLNAPPPAWLAEVGLELTECRIIIRITDHDGWYRLFWAGSETYIYGDPGYLGGALENPSAEASGTWTLKGKRKEGPIDLVYRLRIGAYPGDPAPSPTPGRFFWAGHRRKGDPENSVDSWWELTPP